MKKLLLILLCLPMIGFGQCISGDCENGYGTYTYDLGNWKSRQGGSIHSMVSQYVGQWKDGKYHGQGTYYYPDGRIYKKGLFEDDKFISE